MGGVYAGTHKRIVMYHSKDDAFNAPDFDLFGYATDTKLKRAITKELKKQQKKLDAENRHAKEKS